jgi:hypothetical protein
MNSIVCSCCERTDRAGKKGSMFDKTRLFLSLMKWYAVLEKKGIFVFPRKMKTEIKCKEKFKWYALKEKKRV